MGRDQRRGAAAGDGRRPGRDGSVCVRDCRPAGYRSLLAGLDRDSVRRPLRVELLGRRLRVTFRAPVTVENARLSYMLTAHFDRSCPQIYFVPSTNRDVRRGARVPLELKLPGRCHGLIRGSVRLEAQPTGFPPGPLVKDGPGSLPIGRFRERIP